MNLTLMTPNGEIVRTGQITEHGGYGIQPQDILHFAEGVLHPPKAIDVVVLRKRLLFHNDAVMSQPELRLIVAYLEDDR